MEDPSPSLHFIAPSPTIEEGQTLYLITPDEDVVPVVVLHVETIDPRTARANLRHARR